MVYYGDLLTNWERLGHLWWVDHCENRRWPFTMVVRCRFCQAMDIWWLQCMVICMILFWTWTWCLWGFYDYLMSYTCPISWILNICKAKIQPQAGRSKGFIMLSQSGRLERDPYSSPKTRNVDLEVTWCLLFLTSYYQSFPESQNRCPPFVHWMCEYGWIVHGPSVNLVSHGL